MKKALLPYIAIALFLLACNPLDKGTQIPDLPTESILNEQYYAPYCIYHLKKTDKIVIDKIKNQVTELLPSHQLVDSFTIDSNNNEYMIDWLDDPKNIYPAPDLEYLKYSAHGLSNQEMNQLQSPSSAVVVAFSGSQKNVINDQININSIVTSLLDNSAIVTDYTTYNSFNKKSWTEDRVKNFSKDNQDISTQFTIHTYREDAFCRAVTLGLGKFCLPDISIQQFSCSNQISYGTLINLVSQTWIENPIIRIDTTLVVDIDKIKNDSARTRLSADLESNATKKALISLSVAEPQEGDAYNAQFEIVFNDENFSSKQAQQDYIISQIFGATDEISYITHNDKILAASQEANERLPELKAMHNKGLEPGYSILLKAPFETDAGGREWMWVEVTEWKDKSITGILQNDPYEIKDLTSGAIVDISPDEIFDYMLYLPDGSVEGNKTGEIIEKGN